MDSGNKKPGKIGWRLWLSSDLLIVNGVLADDFNRMRITPLTQKVDWSYLLTTVLNVTKREMVHLFGYISRFFFYNKSG
jgi:hypothetical protein